jgi:thiamine-phosphate pyrophosphorylase
VNDRIDIAMAAGADGVHLTSRSVPLDVVRRHVPKDFVIGVSTHSIDEVSAAKHGGADLAVLGPIFETPGKGEPIGVERLSKAVAAFPEFRLLGLGGVDESNYHEVLDAGASGFAAMRFLNNRQNLEKLSRELGL